MNLKKKIKCINENKISYNIYLLKRDRIESVIYNYYFLFYLILAADFVSFIYLMFCFFLIKLILNSSHEEK